MRSQWLCVLLTVIILEFVLLCDAQAHEDSHLCVKPHNVLKTFVVTKKCRRGSNDICRRTIKKYVKENRTSCCDGWVYSDAESKCIPDCIRGCSRGTCIAPDTCYCEPPLVLNGNISCEEPQCNPSCVNAKCMDDDKCICNEGFTRHNATHCTPLCPDGYITDSDQLSCKPVCDKCVNGNCTAPNTCTCDAGYILENSTCVPYCNQTCTNGKCTAPHTCECNEGYSIDSSDKSLCYPVCKNACVNATCVEPNKCACLTGFEQSSSWTCTPKCDDCRNGECTAPNQCTCLDGYFKADGKKCTPVCTETCTNGYCSAPNTCSCNKGYVLDSMDNFKCQPFCTEACVNATCISPDTCSCNQGFEKLNRSVCTPFCASCQNGVCVSPGNCQCNDGFNRSNGICEPVCSSPCFNGFCQSPENCACNDGYVKNLTQSVCYKPCVGECDNGKCNIDGECLCNFGYKLFNHSCIMPESCNTCNVSCPYDASDCVCEDGRPCVPTPETPAEAAPSTSLAGLQLTWVLGGCVGILLVTIVFITIGYLWRKRKEYGAKPTDNGNSYPSVLYTIPNTLIHNNHGANEDERMDEHGEKDQNETVSLSLLEPEEYPNENEKVAV